MKDKIKVYIEKEALEEFILYERSYRNLLSIFSEHSVLCVNMTEADIENEWISTSLDGQRGGSKLQKFCTGHNIKRPTPSSSDFNSFLEDNHKLLDYSRSMFVLNVTPDKAKELRNKYGVMVMSKESLNDNEFQFHMKDTVKKGEIKNEVEDGWESFFSQRRQPWPPSNVLVFSDEYLFKNDIRKINLGVRNLKSIIPNLLPSTLDTDFQILIISPIPNDNKAKAQRIADELSTFVHGLELEYQCKITFVFTNAVHTRKALSNYYVMTCDKGFCVYLDTPKNKVHDTNFVDITSNFHSAADSSGTTGYDDTSLCLKELKQYCYDAQTQARAGIPTVLITGDCGPNFEIYNRLFD